MALGTIWVFAEIADGKPAPVALELLTKARSLASTVEAVAFAPDAANAAAELGMVRQRCTRAPIPSGVSCSSAARPPMRWRP
jgi:electron transfer flavoprotein alpha subunit